MKTKTVLASVALIAGFVAVTASAQAAAAWAPARKITKLWTFAEGYRVFVPDLSQANPAGCSQTDYARMSESLASNTSKREELNNTVMAAFLARKNVRLRIDDAGCIESRPIFYAIELQE